MNFGENLKKVREKRGLSQKALGEKMGVSQQMIAQYEKLEDMPKFETLDRLSNALNASLSELRVLSHPQRILLKNQRYFSEDIGKWIKKFWDHNSVKILDFFDELNEPGQEKAIEQIELLTKIPEYHKTPDLQEDDALPAPGTSDYIKAVEEIEAREKEILLYTDPDEPEPDEPPQE